ncbi:DMT family transporter [Oricola sp.]|uniref:DMT family transporter n=1 Tax=Oricola sp. TaxID=1979950 RepID=UPI0025E9001F|nr:DMT family transporter [Oricola sp.]MCI5077641.1 DMT family transporter [Oricola sp.]
MPPVALTLALGMFFLFALLDTSGKYLIASGLTATFVVWCRFLSQALVQFVLSRAWSNPDVWRMNNIALQLLRGIALPSTTLLNFKALETLQLAQTVSVFLSAPMVITALAGPMLGEWAGMRRWAAIITGFVGVLVVVRPGTGMFDPAILYSVAATLVYAIYGILTRKLAGSETEASLVFYPSLVGILLLGPVAVMQAQVPATLFDSGLLLVFGVFGLIGHTMFIKASRIASAAKLAPFVYSQLLWMTLLGFIVFGDLPDGWTVLGAAIICASGLYLMYRERRLRLARVSAPVER